MFGLTVAALAALAPLALNYDAGDSVSAALTPTAALQEERAVGSFQSALKREYLTLAAIEANDMDDWTDGQYFTLKALKVDDGQVPEPEHLSDWHLSEIAHQELADARTRLSAALDGHATRLAPVEAARAQTSFDCWIERQEENWDQAGIAFCRDRFEQALGDVAARLESAQDPRLSTSLRPMEGKPSQVTVIIRTQADGMAGPGTHFAAPIYFGSDSARAAHETDRVLQALVDEASALGSSRVEIHVDRNLDAPHLVQQHNLQALAVYERLSALGMPERSMSLELAPVLPYTADAQTANAI